MDVKFWTHTRRTDGGHTHGRTVVLDDLKIWKYILKLSILTKISVLLYKHELNENEILYKLNTRWHWVI